MLTESGMPSFDTEGKSVKRDPAAQRIVDKKFEGRANNRLRALVLTDPTHEKFVAGLTGGKSQKKRKRLRVRAQKDEEKREKKAKKQREQAEAKEKKQKEKENKQKEKENKQKE
jgi:hypothetical protein